MWNALKRGGQRILTIILMGLGLVYGPENFPLFFGEIAAPLCAGLGLVLLAVAVSDICIRIIQPYFDTGEAARKGMARKNPDGTTTPGDVSSAILYFGRNLLLAVMMILFVSAARAETTQMPANAVKNYHLLMAERASYWASMDQPSLLGAQIEQETCLRLNHPKCWTAEAQLKTDREQGVAFGQLTRVWNKTGQLRFDTLSEVVLRHPKELKGYSWSNWNNPELAMRAYVLNMRDVCKGVVGAATTLDAFQMCLSAYNGGAGGLKSDRLTCRATPGCDPSRWIGHVANTSLKSKTVIPGYGQPFFVINRGYVTNVTQVRRVRYLPLDALN